MSDMTDPRGADSRPARSAARLAAVQALYQMEFTGVGAGRAAEEFVQHRFPELAARFIGRDLDEDHFRRVLEGVALKQDAVDRLVEDSLRADWRLGRIDPTLRAILRAGAFELIACADIPAAVTIDEYVEVAHAFFDGDEPGFVNGALQTVAARAAPAA